MVDVNTQNKTISVNVSSSGVSSNVNASGDTSYYYSEKAREWAISNRIVDGVDYSSKYYAGKANESALNAQSFAQSAQDSYNNFQQSVDSALSTVNNIAQGAITTIDTKSDEAIETINNSVDGAIEDIEAEANEQISNIERTGFYMRDDKLYFINSKGEEEEFKSGAGALVSQMENKANISLDNTNQQAKVLMSEMAMPSDKLIGLTVGAVGTIYTAPANGYFHVIMRLADSSGHLSLRDEDNGLAVIQTIPKTNTMAQVSIPARKGARISLGYANASTGSSAYSYLAFIYAVGSESEAS